MPSLRWMHVIFGFAGALSAYAQTSDVQQCIPSWQWTINNKTQNPCLVAAYLESACGHPTSVNAIPVNSHYLGPTGSQQNPCICSSVTYSMVSACGACQGRTYQNWTTWSMNCVKPALTTFPQKISTAVSVPIWAYLNVSNTGGTLNPDVAIAVLSGGPAPTTPIAPTSFIIAVPSASGTTDIAPTATSVPTLPSINQSKHSNTGAIAGGVVGGLVFLAIISLAALWFYMRRRSNAVQRNFEFNSRALVASNPPIAMQTTGSSGYPMGSLYDTSTGSHYPATTLGTSAIYTSAPTASRLSEESLSYSLAHFGGGHQPSFQPVRQQPAFYRGAAEASYN